MQSHRSPPRSEVYSATIHGTGGRGARFWISSGTWHATVFGSCQQDPHWHQTAILQLDGLHQRKGRQSINVQAMTSTASWMWLSSGHASTHDAPVFANSKLSEYFKTGQIPALRKQIVEDEEPIPFFLLGDPAYPFCLWCKNKTGEDLMNCRFSFSESLTFVCFLSYRLNMKQCVNSLRYREPYSFKKW